MWYFMLKSGVHATIAGVLLAFAIPFHAEDDKNISYKLQRLLHYPVAFIILPIFALANTAITFPQNLVRSFTTNNSLGIILGLILGKFTGIFFVSYLAVKTKLATLSAGIKVETYFRGIVIRRNWFTMSIFITNLAFTDPGDINASKISILFASCCAALMGLFVLKR